MNFENHYKKQEMSFPQAPKIKVLLAATQNVFVNTFAELFSETNYQISNIIADKKGIYEYILKSQPHIVFFHGEFCMELIQTVKSNFLIATRCVFVLPTVEKLFLIQGIHTLADAYIIDKRNEDEYTLCIQRLTLGERYISPTIIENLFQNSISTQYREAVEKLGKKEYDVLKYIGFNLPIKEIADKLCISTNTVESHRNNLIKKLGVGDAKELRQLASQMVYSNNQN